MAKFVDASTDVALTRLSKFVDAMCLSGYMDSPSLEKRLRNQTRAIRLFAEANDYSLALAVVGDVDAVIEGIDLPISVLQPAQRHTADVVKSMKRWAKHAS